MLAKENLKDILPLTPMQSGMLFHGLMDENSDAYFGQFALRIHRALNVEAFRESWSDILKRYDTLRTVFVISNVPEPLQLVLHDQPIDFYFEDLRERGITSPAEQEEYIADLKRKDRGRSFQLDRGVLLRILVVQLSDETVEIIFCAHHILMDGWSLGIVLQELFRIYDARLKGISPDLPPVPPYRRYLEWVRKQNPEQTRTYWKEYLAGFEAPVSIPASMTGGDPKKYRVETAHFTIDEETTAAVRRFAAKHQTTVNTILHAAWGLLLGKLCGVTDVVFGAVVSGRPEEIPGIEQMVGLFINTVPVRINPAPEKTVASLIAELREDALKGQANHWFPLPDIQAETPLGSRLFDHILAVENYPLDDAFNEAVKEISGGVGMMEVEAFEQTNYNLNVVITLGNKAEVLFNYNAEVYTEDRIAPVFRYARRLLEEIIDRPEETLGGIHPADPPAPLPMQKTLSAEFDF